MEQLIPSVCADNDLACGTFDIPPLGLQDNARYAVVFRKIGIKCFVVNGYTVVCPSDKFIAVSCGIVYSLEYLICPLNICFVGDLTAAVGVEDDRVPIDFPLRRDRHISGRHG